MLIESIKMKDFRQFRGKENVIVFSTDPEKNVTIIKGNNRSGKTTLLQAFTWCLYGKTDFVVRSVLCNETGMEMEIGSSEEVIVILNLVHNGASYKVSRSQRFLKKSEENFEEQRAVHELAMKEENGNFVPVKDPETAFKKILPQNLARYFFFDGERIENMSKDIQNGHSQDFAEAVKSILGLDVLTSALEHLNAPRGKKSVIKEFSDNYDAKSNEKMDQYNKNIVSTQNKIDEQNENKDNLMKEKEATYEKIVDLRATLKSYDSSRKLKFNRKTI